MCPGSREGGSTGYGSSCLSRGAALVSGDQAKELSFLDRVDLYFRAFYGHLNPTRSLMGSMMKLCRGFLCRIAFNECASRLAFNECASRLVFYECASRLAFNECASRLAFNECASRLEQDLRPGCGEIFFVLVPQAVAYVLRYPL